MNNQELEQQLLSLDLAQRIRILQLLAQSLTVPSASQPSRFPDELEIKRDSVSEAVAGTPASALASIRASALRYKAGRSPQHPLRRIPITIPPDFDESMPELWDALEQ